MIPMHISRLGYALSCLAAQCDGARTDDDIGFSAAHAHHGGLLARIPYEQWTREDEAWVASILPIYRVQLSEMGVNVDDLDLHVSARTAWRQSEPRACILWDADCERYQVVLPSKSYPKARIALRRLDGVALQTKPFRHLQVPVEHADHLAFLAEEYDIERVGLAKSSLAQVKPRDLRARERSVTLEAEQFRLRFPRRDRTLLTLVRAMPYHLRRFDMDDPSWVVLRTPAGATALHQVIEEIDVTMADDDLAILRELAAHPIDDVPAGEYQVVLEQGRVLVVFPYDEKLVELIRTAKDEHNDEMRLRGKRDDFAYFDAFSPVGKAWSWPICRRLRHLITELQATTNGAFVIDDALMAVLNQNAA